MAKFKYYIFDLFEGEVLGSNDDEAVHELAASEDYFIVDASMGNWLTSSNTESDVKEWK